MPDRINVNTASQELLTTLPGIGEELAKRIIQYRKQKGPFRQITDLLEVQGISQALLRRIANQIEVSSNTTKPAEGEFKLTIQLKNEQRLPYTGHTATISYEEILKQDDPDARPVIIARSQTSGFSDDGNTGFEMPARSQLHEQLEIEISAPDGEKLLQDSRQGAKLPDQLNYTLNPKPTPAVQPSDDPNFGKPAKVRGRVLDIAGKQKIAGVQVILMATEQEGAESADFSAVGVAKTDAQGYFSAPYPKGRFKQAYGIIGVEGNPQIPIRLQRDGSFPENVILAFSPEEVEEPEDDCECHAQPGDVPRVPDSGDLTTAEGTFSSDLGTGKCIDFHKPNRVLEEFSFYSVVRTTEPDIRGFTLEDPPKVNSDAVLGILGPLLSLQKRSAASTGTAAFSKAETAEFAAAASQAGIDLDAKTLRAFSRNPENITSAKLERAARYTLHSDFTRLLDRSRFVKPGRTALSCSRTVDWDEEPTIYQACTISHGHILNFKQEWVADGYSMGDLLYSLPLAPCQKKQIVILDWERRESAARSESLFEQEQLRNSLERNRDIQDIVTASLDEETRGGSSANTSAIGGGLGLGFLGSGFGGLLGVAGGAANANSSAWQRSSRDTAAKSLQQLRDRTNQAASAVRSQRATVIQTSRQGERVQAETEVVANHNHCHSLTIQYFEVLRHFLIRQRLVDVQECLFVPLMMTRFDADKALRWREQLGRYLRNRRLFRGFDAIERIENHYEGSDLPAGAYADDNLEHLEGALHIEFNIARPRDLEDEFDAARWNWMSKLLPWHNPSDFYNAHLKGQARKDRIFERELAPEIAEHFVQHLQLLAVLDDNTEISLPIDTTLIADFKNNRPLYVSVRLRESLPAIQRRRIKAVKISGFSNRFSLLQTLKGLVPADTKIIVRSGHIRYRTAHINDFLFRKSHILNDISSGDDVFIDTPLNRRELRNPREEDKERAHKLLAHLNEHTEYYHKAVWWQMSPERRFMLLDGIVAPNAGGRSVASVVENRLIGIVGNCLVMPVARGHHLDPTFSQDDEEPVDLLEHYQPNTPVEPNRVAVPTKGVFAEAVMGQCNACEKKEEDRFWRWEESPCPDSPTPIQPVSTDTRRADPPDLTPKDFPTPIINLQNAPAAPDPTGLAAALQLIGKGDAFRDITGLDANQRNALAALQSSLSSAEFFGGQAANLALQSRMSRDIDKALQTIERSKQAKLIDESQAKALTESAIRSMIGGGTTEQAKPINTDAVKELTKTAGENGAAVSVTRPGGEQVSVDAREKEAEDTPKPSIKLDGNTADDRAFGPAAKDKSGSVQLTASTSNIPSGGSIKWSAVDPSAVSISAPTAKSTQIVAVKAGKVQVQASILDGAGSAVKTANAELSLPQFVTVDEDATKFDASLDAYNIKDKKDDIIKKAKEVAEQLLSTSNVRVVWKLSPVSESLPAQYSGAGVASGNFTEVTIEGEPPEEALFGRTIGPSVSKLNEKIKIFAGAYDDPMSIDVKDAVDKLVTELGKATVSAATKDLAVEMFGRLFGETIAHEILHAMLASTVDASFHNDPAVTGDILNAGSDRDLQQRTGIEVTDLSKFPDAAGFKDHGISKIGGLKKANQDLIDARFPVPPAFS